MTAELLAHVRQRVVLQSTVELKTIEALAIGQQTQACHAHSTTACSQLHNCNCSAASQKQAAGYGWLQLLFEGDPPVQARMTIKRICCQQQWLQHRQQAAGSKQKAASSK